MSYDYIGPLPALKEIALLFPNVRIILNHLGGNVGPAMESEHLERWKVEMADVAASCPNVFCKCGGVQMVTHGHGWETRATPVGSEELADAVRPSLDYPQFPPIFSWLFALFFGTFFFTRRWSRRCSPTIGMRSSAGQCPV